MKESSHDPAADPIMTSDATPHRYAALALQTATHCVNDCPDRDSIRVLLLG